MDRIAPKLEQWRRTHGLSFEELGERIGWSGVTARRIALGMRQADALTIERIVAVTDGAVTVLDLHHARLAYERGAPPTPANDDATPAREDAA